MRRHLPLARRLASRYGRANGADDLQQVAVIGLIKAIDRFDPERGLSLSTFAVPTILGELKRYLRDTDWSVRVPRDLQELALRLERETFRLEAELGRAPTVPELARALEVGAEAVVEAMDAASARGALSLDAPAHEDDEGVFELGDRIGADDPSLARAEDRATIDAVLRRLPARDREILRLRFAEDLTQGEIGRRLGLSQMHVSRLIRRALVRIEE